MDRRSIRQLAAEARSPDGTTRVVVTAEDTVQEIVQRIKHALETGEDDTLTPAAPTAEVRAGVRDAAGGFEEAVETRRTDGIQSELMLETVEIDATRKLELLSQQDHRERLLQRIRDQHEFPQELECWLDYDLDRVDELLDVLRAVRNGYPTSYADIGDLTDKSKGSISHYFNRGDEPLSGVVAKHGEYYELTRAGERAIDFPWRDYLE